ncbi:MAG: ADP-ribosylglycohydrolase family protein [Terriglobales bacterium]
MEAGLVIWEAARRLPAGNGSLMRISPLAVYFADDPLALRQAALDDSAITHADPRCRLACAAFVAAARHALVSPNATTESMHCAAAEELRTAVEYLGPRTPSEYSKQAVAALSEDLELATRSDPHLESRAVHLYRTAGFVRVAFRIAFWELLHAPDFMACVLDCTNRGGDADTNAAIAGALYGALVGESQIPGAWRERVHNCCRGGRPKNPPLMDEYHPRRLFRVMQKFDASNIAAPSTAG